MPEVLLGSVNIRPEHVPPLARGLLKVEEGLPETPRQAELLTRAIKDTLYPGWENSGHLPDELQPFYRVICETPEQVFLAQALKPENARVETIIEESVGIEDQTTNPLLKKLKSVDPKIWKSANVMATGFSAMSIIDYASYAAKGEAEKAMSFLLVGAGLALTSMALTSLRRS